MSNANTPITIGCSKNTSSLHLPEAAEQVKYISPSLARDFRGVVQTLDLPSTYEIGLVTIILGKLVGEDEVSA